MNIIKPVHVFYTISLFIIGLALPLSAQTPANPVQPTPSERVDLWSGKAPVGDGKFEDCNLELEVFLPTADKSNSAAIVLCPRRVSPLKV